MVDKNLRRSNTNSTKFEDEPRCAWMVISSYLICVTVGRVAHIDSRSWITTGKEHGIVTMAN